MDKNEIKRANRKALPKFMLIMVICFIIGGTIGFYSAKYGLNTLAGGMKRGNVFWDIYRSVADVSGSGNCAGDLRSYLSKRNKTTRLLGRRK